jgi:hypothetical protein
METPSTPDDQPDWLSDGQSPSEYDSIPTQDAYTAPDIVPVDEAEHGADGWGGDTGAEGAETSSENDIQEFRDRVIEEVKGGLRTAVEQLTRGDGQHFDAEIIGELIADITEDAAERGDIAKVDQYINTLDNLPGAHRGSFVAACFTGIEAGSTQAFTLLSDKLAAEKAQGQAELEAIGRGEELSDDAILDSEDTLLFELLHVYEANDVAPGRWFDEYATDSTHRWALYNHFYHDKMADHGQRMRDVMPYDKATYDPGPHFASDREHFDQLAADLADNPDFDVDMIVDYTRTTLPYTKDPAVRARLVERYKRAVLETDIFYMEMNVARKIFRDLTAIGTELLSDPELATSDNADYFGAAINMTAAILERVRVDKYLLNKNLLDWRVALVQHGGATPDELIDALQQHTTSLFQMIGQNTLQDAHRDAEIEAHHDRILYNYAMLAAEEGDFSTVKTYASAVIDVSARETIIQLALGYAKTVEEIEPIRPTDVEASVYPELSMHIAFTEARLSGDPTRLAGFAHEYRANLDFDDDPMSTTRHLIGEANRLLAIQTGAMETPTDTEPTPPTLESLQQQYNEIQQGEEPAKRLRALWNLTQQIPR